ncbi:hypothetical protein CapIbe_018727 [Capra ibex]
MLSCSPRCCNLSWLPLILWREVSLEIFQIQGCSHLKAQLRLEDPRLRCLEDWFMAKEHVEPVTRDLRQAPSPDVMYAQ